MQTVSASWAPALASAHGLSVKVDVLYDGDVIAPTREPIARRSGIGQQPDADATEPQTRRDRIAIRRCGFSGDRHGPAQLARRIG